MSGTSLDGVDGVLADFADDGVRVLAHSSAAFAPDLERELRALNSPGNNELHRGALAANALVRVYANVVADLLKKSAIEPTAVRAIGAHGQTVRHQPGAFDGTGYSLQLNNPALLAELTGMDVIADFRSRDLAAGGQGAPLVPAFHKAIFGVAGSIVAVLNIGGISNLSILGPGADDVLGLDCGPGNVLMDAWCQLHQHRAFDEDGAWAGGGQVQQNLLEGLLSEPFFALNAPKSTGRDLFNPRWLAQKLAQAAPMAPVDIQATLAELTARACAACVERYGISSKKLIVCGGGAFNSHLMRRLAAALPWLDVGSSENHGLPPLQVEAAAFAWLARKSMLGQEIHLENVTGARGARPIGALYRA